MNINFVHTLDANELMTLRFWVIALDQLDETIDEAKNRFSVPA